ncbi:MAG: hypothetical protein BGP25_04975 [Lysobacterales bacterium 63-13]|nr:MAG: hypothetical protein BGP25_04975 [Xanthomonadales bacterium 63-13]
MTNLQRKGGVSNPSSRSQLVGHADVGDRMRQQKSLQNRRIIIRQETPALVLMNLDEGAERQGCLDAALPIACRHLDHDP